MANKRIKDLTQTATTLANDDYVAIDGSSNGTRKIVKSDLVNDISSQVAGTYLDEANNLSDVASLDTSKLNLEVPDVGTAPNEVPLNGMLGDMAYQSSEGISAGTVSAETLEVESTTGTATTQALTVTDGSSTKFVVQEDGKVGVGTGTLASGATLDVNGAVAIGGTRVFSKSSTDLNVGSIDGSPAINTINFKTADTVRATINSSGDLQLKTSGAEISLFNDLTYPGTSRAFISCEGRSGTFNYGGDLVVKLRNDDYSVSERLRITNSALVLGSGVGIDFGSAASGTGTPITNGGLLDDYEAGTFTPQVADATSGGNVGSAATATGSYTKVGRVVHFSITLGDIDTTGMTSGNTFYIRNLPFVSSTDPAAQLAAKTDNVTFDAGIVGSVVTGQSNAYLVSLRSANTDVNRTVGHIASGVADILLSGSYIAA